MATLGPAYVPDPPPGSGQVEDVLRWAYAELRKVQETFSALRLAERHVAPTRPLHGVLYLADGTDWNPGSGRGVYWYDADAPAYNFLG